MSGSSHIGPSKAEIGGENPTADTAFANTRALPNLQRNTNDSASVLTSSTKSQACRTATSFKPWHSGDRYYHDIPQDGDPWGNVFRMAQNFDDEMCRAWREEIDTLLVFAGLFSAAVTAFTVESYRWLAEDPTETSMRLLVQISSQLRDLVPNANRSDPLLVPPTPFASTSSAVRVNVMWFTSLTLALTAVLIGILCKQWLREYQRYEGLSAKDAFPVRQLRYEGLIGWHVPKILSTLPLLLQAALVLFFGGLLDLLWTLNWMVASVVTAIVGLAMLMLVTTTFLPCLQHLLHFSTLQPTDEPSQQCAYKSPQSWAFHLLGTWVASVYGHLRLRLFGGTAVEYLQSTSWMPQRNWVQFDLHWQSHGKYTERGICWIEQTFSRNIQTVHHIYSCLESLGNDVAGRCVSRIIEETWNPLVPLVGMLLPTFQRPEIHDEPEKSITQDLILTSYLVMHHRSDENLANRCVEQCVRIMNTSTDEALTSIVLEVLNIVVSRAHPSEDLYEQLFASVKALFTHDRITNSNIDSFFAIFNLLRSLPSGDLANRPTFTLLEEVDTWLRRSLESDIPVDDKNHRIIRCLRGMSSTYWSLLAQTQTSEAKNLVGFDVTVAFVRLLDDLLSTSPEAALLLSPWAEEAWQLTKNEFLSI